MSKYYVQKFVKIPINVMVEANDEFEALRNIAHGDWVMYDYLDDDNEWVIDGIEGNESDKTNYTTIYNESTKYTTVYDKDGNEVRRMTNNIAASYIN